MKNSYRNYILKELSTRKSFDKHYTLKEYARDLSVSSSHLSDILHGKRGISLDMAKKLTEKLSLDHFHSKYFQTLVMVEHARSKRAKMEAQKKLLELGEKQEFNTLSEDQFKFIADLQYYAILEAIRLDEYDGTPLFLAKKLGISLKLTKESLDRLDQLGLVKKENGIYITTDKNFTTTHDIESKALKVSHKQTLIHAIESIDKVFVDKRDITSITMAIDESKLDEAKKRIAYFRREMSEFLESGKKTNVYNLNIQLLPINLGETK